MRKLLQRLLLTALLLAGCGVRSSLDPPQHERARLTPPPFGDPQRGQRLVQVFECSRCHTELSTSSPFADDKSCAGCHGAKASKARYGALEPAPEIHHFVDLPSLGGSDRRLKRGWVERFLLEPHDLRPFLDETMPRLAIDASQARDIAAFVAPDDFSPIRAPDGDAQRGRRLLESKGCGTCHRFSGVPALGVSAIPVPVDPATLQRAVKLAPDLRWARERLLPGYLEVWLRRPSEIRPRTLMPDIPLTSQEIRDVAAYVLTAPLARPALPRFEKLPLLTRRVRYDEVQARVFRKTCWHCHSDPEYAIGDGGPGNTGGFGFRGRGVNLAEYEGVLAGFVDASGRHQSLLRVDPATGQSRLVQALLARHAEEAGRPDPAVRGMPLGLPALPAEDIQLVESWIAQGRPR